MGSFFTNIQVYAGNFAIEELRDNAVNAIRTWVQNNNFVEIDANETADRTVVISPADNGNPWITVYDQATEEQDFDILDQLASTLSSSLNSVAVGILVHDSSVLCLRLFNKGKLRDFYCSSPEYFDEEMSARQRKKAAGNPILWEEYLVNDGTRQDLTKVWSSDTVFAEEILQRTAELLGWNKVYCSTGYNCLDNVGINEAVKLRFKLKEKPLEHQKYIGEGAPKVALGAWNTRLEPRVGETFRLFDMVRSIGGPSQGIDVVIWGPFFQQNILEVQKVKLVQVVQKPNPGRGTDFSEQQDFVGTFEEGTSSSNEKILIVHFNDFNIPKGYVNNDTQGNITQYKKIMSEQSASEFYIDIQGVALSPGKADMCVACVPHENKKEGQTGYRLRVNVAPAPKWRPLYSLNECQHTRDIEALITPTSLFGFIVFKDDIKKYNDILLSTFKNWNDIVAKGGQGTYEAIYSVHSINNLMPQIKYYKVAASKLHNNKKWVESKQNLKEYEYFKMIYDRNSGFGLVNGKNLLSQSSCIELAPQAVYWVDIHNKDQDYISQVTNNLQEIIDEINIRTNIAQAFIGRWAYPPAVDQPGRTPYESACDILGHVNNSKAWCLRYLRGVSEMMWLGEELITYIDLNRLEQVAVTQTSGNGIRLTLNESKTLSELEQVLAPILANKNEYEEAMKKVFNWG